MNTIRSIPQKKLVRNPWHFVKRYSSVTLLSLSFLCFIDSCKNSEVIYPSRKNLIESVYASGMLIPDNEHMIHSIVNGTVLKRLVSDGDTVLQGDLLYMINREMPSLKVQSKNKSNSLQNLGNVSLVLSMAPSTEDISYIRSDCDCVVYQSIKEKGETVHAFEPLALLGNSSGRLARLSVDQMDISKVRIGQLVLLKTDITGDKIYEGQVERIYPAMNESKQTFKVDVTFKDQMNLAFIHNSVEGNIVIQKKENALVLPAYTLIEGDSLRIISNHRQKKIKIVTGIIGFDFIEIIDGIDEKTIVFPNDQM